MLIFDSKGVGWEVMMIVDFDKRFLVKSFKIREVKDIFNLFFFIDFKDYLLRLLKIKSIFFGFFIIC